MSDTKKLGRPKKFDRNTALEAAIKVFWLKGYDGASMKDLTGAMGINGPSLYATFGDKRALYLQAIEAYAAQEGCAPMVAFEAEEDIRLAVSYFFSAAIDSASDDEKGVRGCFISSCVATTAGHVEGVQPVLKDTIEEVDQRLAARFDQEIEKGNLPTRFPSLERARLMFDLRQGYVLRARAEMSGEAMRADLDRRVEMVLSD